MKDAFWAKKPRQGAPTPTVAEHCRDVRTTAEAIFEAVGCDLATALDVPRLALEQLCTLVRAAALLHDIGKVNSAFQYMVRAKPGDAHRQPVRHEILAAWLLTDPDCLGEWFAGLADEKKLWPLIWALAGHHLKMVDPANAVAGRALFNTASQTNTVQIPLMQAELPDLFKEAALMIGAGDGPARLGDLSFDTADDENEGLEQRVLDFAERSCAAWTRLKRVPNVARTTALLKALLIAADVAGSALTAGGENPVDWVPAALSRRMTPELLQSIIEKGTKNKGPLPFQVQVGDSEKNATIVIAGCGNGKTVAAYMWAQRHAAGKKLWFAYPTTGTASAGYQGYLYDHPDLLSVLMHSRAAADLQAMRGSPEDDRNEETLRLDSLRAWDRQAIICTVDTVLGLVQNQRRPLFSFPVIAAGAFVFDEIHSYDGRMFGALLRFLRMFPGVPVLLMSASICPHRLAALHTELGDRVGKPIHGDPNMERHQRYRLEPRLSPEACRSEVAGELRAGKKVLWVCNTVADAIRVAREAPMWAGISPEQIVVYHCRFRYRDRMTRQNEVLAEFAYQEGGRRDERAKAGASLIIATQVCEMSLDISADLMVTAECPLPALVQRLGRLNRYASGDDPWKGLVYPFQGDPYNEKSNLVETHGDCRASMAATRAAVQALGSRPCSQRDLAECLSQMEEAEKIENYSAWLDDGWITEPAQLRAAGQTITLIRDEDLAEIEKELGPEQARRSRWTAASLVPWTIPMRMTGAFRSGRPPAGGYPVAAWGTVAYSEKEGATWRTSTN